MTLRPSNRWFAQRYSASNAWNFNGTNGNLNNNSVGNQNLVQAVTNLPDGFLNVRNMNRKSLFAMCVYNYFRTRRNKRYGRDQMDFEADWVSRLLRFFYAIVYRTLRIDHNFAFLTSYPVWREIFASVFEGRMTDHMLCDPLIPYMEAMLSPRTYNNRTGKGTMAAVNQVIEDIYKVTDGYTRPARIIKWDIKGFFPSALWEIMQRCYDRVIDSNAVSISEAYGDEFPGLLHWLAMLCVNTSPTAHCELRTPPQMWHVHIKPEKSAFTKPPGVSAPIGRLVAQHAMGMYINDDVKWLCEDCGIDTVVFVDDGVMVVPERLHAYALAKVGELRERFALKGLRMNERKFYDQPYQNGLELLGSHIRPYRIHVNNKTYRRARERMVEINGISPDGRLAMIDSVINSINSYFSLLKTRTDYRRLTALRDMIDGGWWKYLEWDAARLCVTARPQYSFRRRMDRKYGLRLRFKERRA